MRKAQRVLISIILSISMIFSLQGVNAAERHEQNLSDGHNDEFYITQMKSLTAYNDILDGLGLNRGAKSLKSYSSYADCYGGAYINGSTGSLVVLSTDISPEFKDAISTCTNEGVKITYQECEISYSEIITAIEEITELMEYFDEQGIYIDSVYDDIKNGRVIVEVRELDQEKENAIRSYAPYDFLIFKASENVVPLASVGPGSECYNEFDDLRGSVGFPASLDGKKGFVTAAHIAERPYYDIKLGNEIVGKTIKTAVSAGHNIKADAAFVEASKGTALTNTFMNGGMITGYVARELPLDTTLYTYGQTTKLVSGKITSVNASSRLVFHGVSREAILTGSYRTTVPCRHGDSGGPAMILLGFSEGQNRYSIAGIVSQGTGIYTEISPYKNIVEQLGIQFIYVAS